MSLGFHWLNGSNTVNLGTAAVRLGTINGLNIDGVTGGSSISTLLVDDPTGVLSLTGLRPFWITEDAAPAGNQVVWHGRLGIRRVKRGGSTSPSLITDVARLWECELVDDSGDLHNFRIASGKRPAETAAVRGAWLVAEDPLVNDYGLVHWPTLDMDANDYTGQYAADVLGDIAAQSGVNFFLYWDETNGGRGLWLDDPDSANDTSGLRISNVLADLDGSTTWAPTKEGEAVEEIDPTRVASGVDVTYATGSTYVSDSGTATAFTHIDRSAPMSNIKTAAAATAAANRFLADNATEDMRVPVTIRVPAAHVNDARVGQRIAAKFSHLPGFAAFHWCRILNRSVVADEEDDTQYKIPMLLSPIGLAFGPGGVIDDGTGDVVDYYTGDIFAAVLLVEDDVMPLTWATTGDSPTGGWGARPTIGPATPTAGADGYVTINVPAIVRVNVQISTTGVGAPGAMFYGWVHQVKLDGTVIILDAQSFAYPGGGLGGWSPSMTTDVHDVEVEAGDKIIAGGSFSGWAGYAEWYNWGVDQGFIYVGRGTISFGVSGTWVGP